MLTKIKIINGEHSGDICTVLEALGGGSHKKATHLRVRNQDGIEYILKKRNRNGLKYVALEIKPEELDLIKNEQKKRNKILELTEQLNKLGKLYDNLKEENKRLKLEIETLSRYKNEKT